jgi:hypothetical protein
MNLLCRLGLHRLDAGKLDWSDLPYSVCRRRKCERCGVIRVERLAA